MKLYKGSAPGRRPLLAATRSTTASLAGFGESGGEFCQAASPGFIELFTPPEPDGAPGARPRPTTGKERWAAEPDSLYELIGRLVVASLAGASRRELRIAGGVGVVAAASAGYLIATREPPEG